MEKILSQYISYKVKIETPLYSIYIFQLTCISSLEKIISNNSKTVSSKVPSSENSTTFEQILQTASVVILKLLEFQKMEFQIIQQN